MFVRHALESMPQPCSQIVHTYYRNGLAPLCIDACEKQILRFLGFGCCDASFGCYIGQALCNITCLLTEKGKLTTQQTLHLAQAIAEKRLKEHGKKEGYEAFTTYLQILQVISTMFTCQLYALFYAKQGEHRSGFHAAS